MIFIKSSILKAVNFSAFALVTALFTQSVQANNWEAQLESAVSELKQSPPSKEMLKCYGVNQEKFIQAYKKAFMKCYPEYVPQIAKNMTKEKDLLVCFESELLAATGATREQVTECAE